MGLITNANTILQKDDFHYEEIEVPEWGGTLRLKSLSGTERTAIIKLLNQKKDTADGVYEKAIIFSAVNADGGKIFEDNASTLAILQSKDAAVTQRIGAEVMKLSGLSADSKDEAEKN